MQKYIEQLIEDFNTIINNGEGKDLNDVFVIEYSQLPNSDRLNDEQVKDLLEVIEKAFWKYKVKIDTEDADFRQRYENIKMLFANTEDDYKNLRKNN